MGGRGGGFSETGAPTSITVESEKKKIGNCDIWLTLKKTTIEKKIFELLQINNDKIIAVLCLIKGWKMI